MNFNQPEYGVFLFVVFWAFWALKRRATPREALLLVASYVFYGAWNPRYLVLLAFSTVVDYYVALGLAATESPGRRRLLLLTSLTVSLGLLGTFKYFNFFSEQVAEGLAHLGLHVSPAHLNVLLPAGISFYTFQTMNYVIDVYRGSLKPARSFLEFAVFVSFFPHLVAGPILRASYFIPQVQREPEYDHSVAMQGVYRILLGLSKKALFADFVGFALVDPVFRHLHDQSALMVLLALYGYAVQIYSDFSGYSDIAIGSALLLGFRIPENFEHPYLAENPRQFWARWHISLSTWLRDYLYIPLGGSRGSRARTCFNLLVTMLLGGLWHGANWTFVAWGALHGLLLAGHRFLFGREAEIAAPSGTLWRRALFFHFVCLTWLFFRADSLGTALVGLSRLSEGSLELKLALDGQVAVALVFLALAMHFGHGSWKEYFRQGFLSLRVPAQALVATAVIILVAGLGALARPFIYFQF
jgi:alginate O-acetyltransferase complex protein AlgI